MNLRDFGSLYLIVFAGACGVGLVAALLRLRAERSGRAVSFGCLLCDRPLPSPKRICWLCRAKRAASAWRRA